MKFLHIALIAFFMTACGFHPLYQGSTTLTGGTTTLDKVTLGDITGAQAQQVKNELIDRFYHNGTPANTKYILKISLSELIRDLVIQKNDTTTRAQLVLLAQYQFLDKDTREMIDIGSLRAVSSYNILPSQYSTLVTQNDARDRNVRELADKLTTRLAVVLEGK